MKIVIVFENADPVSVNVQEYFEVRIDKGYVEIDGEIYGASQQKEIRRVSPARSERPIDC